MTLSRAWQNILGKLLWESLFIVSLTQFMEHIVMDKFNQTQMFLHAYISKFSNLLRFTYIINHS